MSIKRIAVAAVAAFGLSLGAYSASAGPLNEALPSHAPSTFTLIAHGGGHGGGGHGGGGHGGGMHAVECTWAGCTWAGMHMAGHRGMHAGRITRAGGGRTAFYHGGRRGGGYWRGGRWYGRGWYGGGSCYGNCLAAGYGPGYCSVYSYNFCY